MRANNGTDFTCTPGYGNKQTSFDWWQDAMNSGMVIDRSEMKELLGK